MVWFMTVFGMNVGGVPWTNQNVPELKDGFHNVMFLCVALILLVLFCFLFPEFYASVSTWKRRRDMKRSRSLNHKSSFRSSSRERNDKEGYQRLYWLENRCTYSTSVFHQKTMEASKGFLGRSRVALMLPPNRQAGTKGSLNDLTMSSGRAISQ